MKAIRKLRSEQGAMEYMDIPEPEVKSGMVKVKVHACGICGSDMKFYHWNMRPGMSIVPPVTFGHEYSGVITEIGQGVTEYKVGDRVVSETANYICGKCQHCITGNYLLCEKKKSIGYQEDGAFAEYICVREELLHRIPQSVSMDEASMGEPTCVAFHGVADVGRVMPEDWVLITGPGTIGLLTVQIAKAFGGKVILAGLSCDWERLEVGAKMGADLILKSDEVELDKEVKRITGGLGADIAFECSGSVSALDSAIGAVKKQGTVVVIALFENGVQGLNNLNKLVNNEIVLKGSYGQRNWNWGKVLQMMESKKLDVTPLITHRFVFSDWQVAFDTAESMSGIKILLYPKL